VWSSKSNVQCSMLEPKKEEKGGLRGDQTKKCWSQKKEEKRGLRGDQTKKCWSQKNQEEKREGRSQGKHWSQNKKETGCEKSHDDISVPSFNATLLGQAWKFCIFWEPGSEPKKVQEPKKRKRKGEKGRQKKREKKNANMG